LGLPNWVVTPIGEPQLGRHPNWVTLNCTCKGENPNWGTPIGSIGKCTPQLKKQQSVRGICIYTPQLGCPIGLPSSHFLLMLSQVLAIAIIWTCQQKHLRFFGSGKRNKWREHTVHCCLLRIGFWECCLPVWQRTFVRRIQYSWNSPTAFLSVGQYLVQPVFLFFYHGTQLELPNLSFD